MPNARPERASALAREARSGLPPYVPAELPAPPTPRGLGQWMATVGPGIIVLGAAIGSGEFLLGPATFVKYGLTLLWITTVATFLQTVFNTELMRYTLATGEPAFTGFMRTRPHASFWAWVYVVLYILQQGWPAWAGTAAGAFFFVFAGRLAAAGDATAVYLIAVAAYVLCFAVLLFGRRVERTLEWLNWILVICVMTTFIALAIAFVPAPTWLAALTGLAGFDPATSSLRFVPANADFFLLGAFAGFSGLGGITNVTLSNWARDKGYGMGQVAGYIPGAVGGQHTRVAPTGFMFVPDEASLPRWRGWWRIVRVDQWGIFFIGALLGMALPALLYVTFIPAGTDIRGLGIAAELARSMARSAGPAIGIVVALLGAWILFKTQLDVVEGMTRSISDMLWTGSARVRRWRGGDVRIVYYGVLGVIVLWGVIALRFATPILLLQIGANIAGIVMVIASLHLLRINTTLLPEALRPPRWRRVCLVATALFYGTFVVGWLASLVRAT